MKVTFLSRLKDLFQGNNTSGKKQGAYAIDGYEAATFSRDRSRLYHYAPETDGNPSTYTRREILSISRYAVKNFPLTERILSVTEFNGIGPGLFANAATADAEFNAQATAAFEQWAGNAFCSANNQYNLYEMQRLLARELVLAGEVFIVLVKSPSGYPQLMLVRSEDVRSSADAEDDSEDGLYKDDFGKVTAYNVFTGKSYQKVDASNVIHLIRHKDINQLRGLGSFAASLNSQRDRKDCIDLEKKAVKIHSRIAAVITKDGGELPNPFTGGDDIRIDSSQGFTTNDNPTPPSNLGRETPFGEAVVLNKGEKVDLLASERSTDGFLQFLEMLVRETCLNISLPYEFVYNPDKLNGTAIRFILNDAAAFFRDIQDRIIDGALNRIYAWVIASFINAGKLSQPASGLPWAASFTRPQSITVDTQRVSNAEIAQLQNGLLNYETYYSARGKDWKHELRQRAQEEAYLDKLSNETGVAVARLRTLAAGTTAFPESDFDEIEEEQDTDTQKAA